MGYGPTMITLNVSECCTISLVDQFVDTRIANRGSRQYLCILLAMILTDTEGFEAVPSLSSISSLILVLQMSSMRIVDMAF